MTVTEIVRSMSEEDVKKAAEAFHADLDGDMDRAVAALEAMSIDGIRAFVAALECKAAQEDVNT